MSAPGRGMETWPDGRVAGDPEALVAWIRAAAGRRAEAALAGAESRAAALLAGARQEAEREARALHAAALAGAAAERERLLAGVDVATALLRARLIERELDAVREAVRRRLPEEAARRPGLSAHLAAEALRAMGGGRFAVVLAPSDYARRDELRGEILGLLGRDDVALEFRADAALTGGARVEDAGGRRRFDNGLDARLGRMWPALRLELSAAFAGKGETDGRV